MIDFQFATYCINRLTPKHFAIFVLLLTHGECCDSQRQIAKKLGIGYESFRTSLVALRKAGFVDYYNHHCTDHGHMTTDIYWIRSSIKDHKQRVLKGYVFKNQDGTLLRIKPNKMSAFLKTHGIPQSTFYNTIHRNLKFFHNGMELIQIPD